MSIFSGFDTKLGDMPPEQKEELLVAGGLFVLLLAAAVFTMLDFMWLTGISGEPPAANAPLPDLQGMAERKEVDSLSGKYELYSKSRTYSGQMVTLAKAVGKPPVGSPAETFVAEAPMKNSDVPPAVVTPPVMTLKALVVMDGASAAAVDIEGERPGLIIKSGSTFDGGKGRILAVDAGGVSWTWSRKKYRTNF